MEVTCLREVMHKLEMSFYYLQDDHDKDLFLNIACFFVGKDKDYITTILEGCGFYPKIGIENLVDRYLLKIDENNKLGMHQLLQAMGREIVHLESRAKPEKRSRLWHHEDAFGVVRKRSVRLMLLMFI